MKKSKPSIHGTLGTPNVKGGGGEGLTGEKNYFFYKFFSKLSFKYKY